MTIDLNAAAAAGWARFKRDRDVLLTLAGTFLLLPVMARLVLVPPAPDAPPASAGEAAVEQWAHGFSDWLVANLPIMGITTVMTLVGTLAILAFMADRARPDVGGALWIGVKRLPALFVQALLLSLPVSFAVIGALVAPLLLVLLVPGFWLLGRGFYAPVVLATSTLGPIGSIHQSFAMTRGQGLVLAGLASVEALGSSILAAPFTALLDTMRAAHAANPVAVMLVAAPAAGCVAVVALGITVLRVVLYDRASSGT